MCQFSKVVGFLRWRMRLKIRMRTKEGEDDKKRKRTTTAKKEEEEEEHGKFSNNRKKVEPGATEHHKMADFFFSRQFLGARLSSAQPPLSLAHPRLEREVTRD